LQYHHSSTGLTAPAQTHQSLVCTCCC
jgi:hypothetical protein